MAQVRAETVKDDHKDVHAKYRQKIDLIAEQKDESRNRNTLNNRASCCEEQSFDRVCACHRKRGQRLGAVMEFMKGPQHRNTMKRKVHGKAGEIVKQEEEQGEADRRDQIPGILEQADRDQRLVMQQLVKQGRDSKLCHKNRSKPGEQHSVDHEADDIMTARAAEPDAAVEDGPDGRPERMALDQAKPEDGDDRGREQIPKEQPLLRIKELRSKL